MGGAPRDDRRDLELIAAPLPSAAPPELIRPKSLHPLYNIRLSTISHGS
jgi:hypothetical protein